MQAYRDRTSPMQRWIHAILAAWVCPNIFFNYIMAIVTPPGTTTLITKEVGLLHFFFCYFLLQLWDRDHLFSPSSV
jgi:hypothetical protein